MYTQDGGGIIIAFLGPSILTTTLHSSTGSYKVRVEQQTDYPFTVMTEVNITATATQPFPLQIRIPGWMVEASVLTPDGTTHSVKAGAIFTFQHQGGGEQRLVLEGRGELSIERRYNNAATLSYGPLVFAMEFPYNTTVLRRYSYGASDVQLLPINATSWQYALLLDETKPLNESLTLTQHPIPAMPFDANEPPLRLGAYGRQVVWPEEMPGVAAAPPVSPVQSKSPLHPITLIPYASSMLRIAEIPTLELGSTSAPTTTPATAHSE